MTHRAASRRTLIVPVESQLRELESKLLLACVAAERGFPVVIGSRAELHLRIGSLPRGIYLAKSLAPSSVRMLKLIRGLGNEIVGWVENVLVERAQSFFEARLSADAVAQVSALLAWGENNAERFRRFPPTRAVPIRITGNPRIDVLRPELRSYFEPEAQAIRDRFGSFILINTNFVGVNHYLRERTYASRFGDPGKGDDYGSGRAAYTREMVACFQELVPALAKAFPAQAIVVRPHPIEDPEPWRKNAAQHANVHVILEGNVVPWLMAARVLIHSSCTTGVESFLLGVPTIAYQPIASERFLPKFPNCLGHPAFGLDDVRRQTQASLEGRLRACDAPEQWQGVRHYVDSFDGPLASDRIVDVLEEIAEHGAGASPRLDHYLATRLRVGLRAAKKRRRSRNLGTTSDRHYQRHRFPGLQEQDVSARVHRLARQLGRFEDLRVRRLAKDVVRIAREPS